MRATPAAPATVTTAFCIAADHPALPGHFPGAAVVPGALLLAEGLQRLESLTAPPVQWRRIDSAKFLRPVAPGTTVTATLTMTAASRASIEFCVAGVPVAHVALATAVPTGVQPHA